MVRSTRFGERGRIQCWVPLEVARELVKFAADERRMKNDVVTEALQLLFASRRKKGSASRKR